MSPDKISDGALRSRYEKSIYENEVRKKRGSQYIEVKMLDDDAMSGLEAALRLFNEIAPDHIGPDATALESIFRAAGISGQRLRRIRAMIYEHAMQSKTGN